MPRTLRQLIAYVIGVCLVVSGVVTSAPAAKAETVVPAVTVVPQALPVPATHCDAWVDVVPATNGIGVVTRGNIKCTGARPVAVWYYRVKVGCWLGPIFYEVVWGRAKKWASKKVSRARCPYFTSASPVVVFTASP